MATLEWNAQLVLQQAQMDQTHVEFVQHLAALEDRLATAAHRPADTDAALAELLLHTVAHFAQEEAWMARLGFAAENCHAFQHRHVLQVMREVQRLWQAERDTALLGQLVGELAKWFPVHAQTMDAGLAQTMAEAGLDPNTGALAHPPPPNAPARTGCGSSACTES
jgi:hemerythrin